MKKSLLSIVLAVAVAMTAFGAMFVMPAAALNGNDFLVEGAPSASDGMTYEMVDGALVITATAAGQELALTIEGEANLNDYPFWEASIDSEIPYDVALYDPNNSKWMFAAGDFCYNFEPNNGASRPIPASNQSVKFTLTGAYTWTGDPLPANAAVKSITFIAKEAGKMTISKCAMTDGMVDIDLNTRGDVSDMAWDNTVSLIEGDYVNCPAPSADDPQSSVTVTKNNDGSVTYGNTNGMWPSAAYTFDEPIVVDGSAALELDFTVSSTSNTTIYIFMGPSTPDSFGDGAYVWIANPDNLLNTDLSGGNYKGVVFLDDIIDKTIGDLDAVDKCKDADGNYVITGVKVFATNNSGATDNAVTVRKFNVVSMETEEPAVDLGDMDNDGDVDTYDALIIFNAAAGYIELTAEETTVADMNVDDVVDTYDALLAFSEASGIPVEDLIG